MLVSVLGSIAHAGTVCAAGQTGCDWADLAEGVAVGDPVLELQPGLHFANVTIDRPIEIVADPEAVVMSVLPGQPVITVFPGGSGSVFHGLVYGGAFPDVYSYSYYDGPLIRVVSAEVTVSGARVQDLSNVGRRPVFLVEDDGALVLVDPVVESVWNPEGGGVVRAVDATLVVTGGRFVDNRSARGGAIFAEDSDVVITDTTFERNSAGFGAGNTMWVEGGTVALDDVRVAGDPNSGGSAVRLEAVARVEVTESDFSNDETGSWEYALQTTDTPEVRISGSTFANWSATAVYIRTSETVVVEDTVFHDNFDPDSGGALWVETEDLRVDGSWFCDNVVGDVFSANGGALYADCTGSCVVTGSVFQDNDASFRGGAIRSRGLLDVSRSTFVGNSADSGGAMHALAGISVDHTIFFAQDGEDAAVVASTVDVFDTNALGSNKAYDTSFWFDEEANRRRTAPAFVDAPGRCGTSVTPTSDRYRNGWILDNDVGAIVDADGDEFFSDVDCDDSRTDVFPGAPEHPTDGLDSDCDGFELCPTDADGDGWSTDGFAAGPIGCEPRPGDCDDQNPDIGACERRIGGGCETAPGPGGLPWLGLLVFGIRPRVARATPDPGFVRARLPGLGGIPFTASVCTSVNEVVCHGLPRTTVVLNDGGIVNVDVTTELEGCSVVREYGGHGIGRKMHLPPHVDHSAAPGSATSTTGGRR